MGASKDNALDYADEERREIVGRGGKGEGRLVAQLGALGARLTWRAEREPKEPNGDQKDARARMLPSLRRAHFYRGDVPMILKLSENAFHGMILFDLQSECALRRHTR